jgi:peptidoglycan/LPS O-acetylase OafA/YrhL
MRLVYHKQLDGLRCIAVIGPLISHWLKGTFMDFFPFGYGVFLFFVLSGFLITNILLRQKENIEAGELTLGKSYSTFLMRRTLRIFPVYYLVIFTFLILKSDPVRENLPWLLTYTINIKLFLVNHWLEYLTHLWTLAIEEQFYLFFPLVVFLVPARSLPSVLLTFIVASLASKTIHYFYSPEGLVSSITFPLHSVDSLSLGALLSFYSRYRKNGVFNLLNKKLMWLIFTIFFITVTWIYYSAQDSFPVNNFVSRTMLSFLFSVLCVYLVGVAATTGFKGLFASILENSTVVYVGKISYGIYLIHNFAPTIVDVIEVFTGLYLPQNEYSPIMYVVITFAFAALSWKYFESPINSLKKNFKY